MNLSAFLHGHTICVPNGGGLSLRPGSTDTVEISLYLSRMGLKFFWGNNLYGHIILAGNIRILFCNVFSYFFIAFTCLMEMIACVCVCVGGENHSHYIMDLILMSKGEQKVATMEKLSRQ